MTCRCCPTIFVLKALGRFKIAPHNVAADLRYELV